MGPQHRWYVREQEMATTQPRPTGWRGAADRVARARGPVDLLLLAGMTVVLFRIFLAPGLAHGYSFPVGPDLPVYLWWARVGAAEGVSLVGERPGTPALLPTLSALLGGGLLPAIAGLQYALGPAIGLAAAAVLRGRGGGSRPAWVVGGLLAGLWATHLAGGFIANLVFAAPYLAAAAALTRRTTRGTIAAAVLLGGGGLAHPQFFVVGGAVLAVAAGWSALLDDRFHWRSDGGRAFAALLGGAGIVGGGIVAALAGPARIAGDTSKDALLRRAGQWAILRDTYLDRFRHDWRRYAPFMITPLAIAGGFRGRGFSRRFLVAWAAFTVVTVPIGALTGWFPPDRMLTFAFCVPMLAALGLVWLGERLGRWWLAWPVGIVLAVLISLPTLRSWNDQKIYLSPDELHSATVAGRIADTTEPDTSLVFVVNDPSTSGLFLAAHSLNVARATVPPDRVRDVYVYVGDTAELVAGRPTVRGDPLYDLASRTTLAEIPTDRPMAVFVVREFNRVPEALADPSLGRWDVAIASSVPNPRSLQPLPDELAPATANELASAAIRTFLLLTVLGLGWAWWAMVDASGAFAIAPAFGVATLTIAALGLERLGVGVQTTGGATLAAALAGGSGYALLVLRLVRQRDDRRRRVLVLEREPDPQP